MQDTAAAQDNEIHQIGRSPARYPTGPRHPQLWPLFAGTARSATFQGVDWYARRASLRPLVPPTDVAGAREVPVTDNQRR